MSLFDLVFGCWHKRCSFPLTVRGKLRRSSPRTDMGKLHRLYQQPKTKSNKLISTSRLKR